MPVAANNLSIRLQSDAFEGDEVRVAELTGREHISQLYQFHLTVVTNNPAGLDADRLMRSRVSLLFEHVEENPVIVREIHGIVSQVQDGLSFDHDHATYRLTFVPRMWLTTLHETLDIHMDMSVPEIITKVLKRGGLREGADVEMRLRANYLKREFVVQYQETDLAFVSRIAEHNGIFFFFEHTDGVDKVVFSDHNTGFQPIEGEANVEFNPHDTDGNILTDRVVSIESTRRLISSRYTVRDYNYRTPSVDLQASAPIDDHAGGDVVEYGAHFKSPDEARRFARIRAEEVKCLQHVLHGQSNVSRMRAGCTLSIVGHPRAEFQLLLVEVNHQATQGVLAMGDNGGGAGMSYENTFTTIPGDVPFRAARVTPKPKVSGVITGMVEATQKSPYAELDADGRYTVRFLYDTSEAGEGQASRPVRMAQPHSGPNYGMHFPMRGGTEVILTCIDGDPDRPIIAGTVPNPSNSSPVTGGNHTRNVIRTGGNNEINMDDTDGKQRIKLSTPNTDAVFQMGQPNGPELGVLISTATHYSGFAKEGISTITNAYTSYSKIKGVFAATNIVSIAGVTNAKETPEKVQEVTDAAAEGIKGLLEAPKKMMEVEKGHREKLQKRAEYEKRVADREVTAANNRLAALDAQILSEQNAATAAEARESAADAQLAGMPANDPRRGSLEAERNAAHNDKVAHAAQVSSLQSQRPALVTAQTNAQTSAAAKDKEAKESKEKTEAVGTQIEDFEQHGVGKALKVGGAVVGAAPGIVKAAVKAKGLYDKFKEAKGTGLIGKLKGMFHKSADNANLGKAEGYASGGGGSAAIGRTPGSAISVASPYHIIGAKGTIVAYGDAGALLYGVGNVTAASDGQANLAGKAKAMVHSPGKVELAGNSRAQITSNSLVDTLSKGRLKSVSNASSAYTSKATMSIASKATMSISTKASLKVTVRANATEKITALHKISNANFKMKTKAKAEIVAGSSMKALAKVWGMEAKPGKVTVGGKGAGLEVNGGNTKIKSKAGAEVACNSATITAKANGKITVKAGGVAQVKGSKVMLG